MAVEISTTPGGLRVATEKNDCVESVSLGIWVDVGTRHEKKSQNGICHLLEHMLFKGTKNRRASEIAEEIEAVGGQLNAYTSREHTTFYAKVLKENVSTALDILSDILINPVLDETEFRREQEVILQEIGQAHDSPEDLIFDRLQKRAYPGQSLGRPILGTEKSVSALKRDDLPSFMARHFTADNMILVAAGNLEHSEIVKRATDYFGDLPQKGFNEVENAAYSGGETRTSRKLEQLHLALGFETCSYLDADYFAAQFYTTILGGGMSSRLFQEVREKRGFAYSVYAFNAALKDTGLLNIYAGTGPEYVEDLIPVIAGQMQALADRVGERELERARAQLKAGLLMTLENTANRIEQIGKQILVYGRPLDLEDLVSRIDRIDQKAVNKVAEKVLKSPITLAGIGAMRTAPSFKSVNKTFEKF